LKAEQEQTTKKKRNANKKMNLARRPILDVCRRNHYIITSAKEKKANAFFTD
jgi:hypothetical protein